MSYYACPICGENYNDNVGHECPSTPREQDERVDNLEARIVELETALADRVTSLEHQIADLKRRRT